MKKKKSIINLSSILTLVLLLLIFLNVKSEIPLKKSSYEKIVRYKEPIGYYDLNDNIEKTLILQLFKQKWKLLSIEEKRSYKYYLQFQCKAFEILEKNSQKITTDMEHLTKINKNVVNLIRKIIKLNSYQCLGIKNNVKDIKPSIVIETETLSDYEWLERRLNRVTKTGGLYENLSEKYFFLRELSLLNQRELQYYYNSTPVCESLSKNQTSIIDSIANSLGELNIITNDKYNLTVTDYFYNLLQNEQTVCDFSTYITKKENLKYPKALVKKIFMALRKLDALKLCLIPRNIAKESLNQEYKSITVVTQEEFDHKVLKTKNSIMYHAIGINSHLNYKNKKYQLNSGFVDAVNYLEANGYVYSEQAESWIK